MISLSVSVNPNDYCLPYGDAEVESTSQGSQIVELPRNRVAVLVQGVKQLLSSTSSYIQEQMAVPFEDERPLLSQTVGGSQVNSEGQLRLIREEAPTRRLQTYLRNLAHSGEVDSETASLAWRVWNQLRAVTAYSLPVPNASPLLDNRLLYTWDNAEHHFEVEIFPEGTGEFFYRNRASGQLWESEYMVGQVVPQEVIDKLGLFL